MAEKGNVSRLIDQVGRFRKNLASGECQPSVMTVLMVNAIAAGIALVTLIPMQVYERHARKKPQN